MSQEAMGIAMSATKRWMIPSVAVKIRGHVPSSLLVAEPDRLAFPIKIRNIDFMCGSICIFSGISSHLHKRAVFSAAEEIRRIKEPRAPLRNFTLAAQELLRGPRGAHSCGVIPHPPLPPSHPRPPGPREGGTSVGA